MNQKRRPTNSYDANWPSPILLSPKRRSFFWVDIRRRPSVLMRRFAFFATEGNATLFTAGLLCGPSLPLRFRDRFWTTALHSAPCAHLWWR
jgi:hypothetical protein